MQEGYRGSEEEKRELLAFYTQFHGDMNQVALLHISNKPFHISEQDSYIMVDCADDCY